MHSKECYKSSEQMKYHLNSKDQLIIQLANYSQTN
jgi:hypothetical protein